ncbi:MAG: transcription elongation factor GreA [Humidesulfovibrio sp.]|uniref:transcription elongation factor GreA n=1 Tax=Humidesulfovibrio sp. TaxID=2910988 RepID=UPI00273612BF|nr:transcription elongation factor GreA [Humidesulfovibrio sp.]MDP2849146.1 transcription elongation factor GreA [Humidesulfovibrio sp.]
MSSLPISQEGYKLMKKELESLKKQRPEVSEAIRLAREEGDLRENGGYHAARERQGMMEARINFIESRMAKYNVIDMKALGGDKISFGATVELQDVDTGEQKRYTLLGPDETGFCKGSVSILSPVGQALLGKHQGDEVVIIVPRGRVEYEVLNIEFNGPAISVAD